MTKCRGCFAVEGQPKKKGRMKKRLPEKGSTLRKKRAGSHQK